MTTERWLAFTPRDTVAVRDGRSFQAGADSSAETVRPWPSTIAGAVRAAYGEEPAAVRGPVLARRTGSGGWEPHFPMPADVVRAPGSHRGHLLRPVPELDGIATDLGEGLLAPATSAKVEPVGAGCRPSRFAPTCTPGSIPAGSTSESSCRPTRTGGTRWCPSAGSGSPGPADGRPWTDTCTSPHTSAPWTIGHSWRAPTSQSESGRRGARPGSAAGAGSPTWPRRAMSAVNGARVPGRPRTGLPRDARAVAGRLAPRATGRRRTGRGRGARPEAGRDRFPATRADWASRSPPPSPCAGRCPPGPSTCCGSPPRPAPPNGPGSGTPGPGGHR